MKNLRLFVIVLFLATPWATAHADEWHFTGVARIVAVGDVHGAYDALVETLRAAAVVDGDAAWSGGKTHLVFTGDLVDRGAESRRVMDLVMQLEKQARKAGGRVHMLLGNHEVMNLNGDLRYVSKAEFASYEDLELNKDRERWFKDFLASQPEGSDEVLVRAEFDEMAPPGFFGHRRAFRHDGKYGKWLLKKPFIIVINDTAFVHGGLPRFVAEHGMEGANVGLKNDLDYYVRVKDELADSRVLNPIYQFKKIPAMLQERQRVGDVPNRYANLVQAAIDLSLSPLHTPIGPTWYRGTAACSTLAEGDVLDAAFAEIDASRVVIGHTFTITRQVQERGGGRTLEIDTGMLSAAYGGSGNALVIDGGALTVVNQDGRTGISPVAHPIRVGNGLVTVEEDTLAKVLAEGAVKELTFEGEPLGFYEVTSGELTVYAKFFANPDEGFAPELAAYRLDRMLKLGMVPVTVPREVAGQQGVLQIYLRAVQLVGMMAGVDAPCTFDKQLSAMRVFDALIGNSARAQSSILYDQHELLLVIIENGSAFGTGENQPGHAQHTALRVGNQWQIALRGLDDETLQEALGDVLDERRLIALRQRRDDLLHTSASAGAH